MFTEGVKVTIGGKELNLVLNTEAMAQICDKYGSIEKIGDKLNASYSEKVLFIPELIALLATQGEAIKGSGEVITKEFVARFTAPRDFDNMSKAFIRAIEIGMNIQIDNDNEETDEVLAEIQKNAPGAAGN